MKEQLLKKITAVCLALFITGSVWAACGKDSCGSKKDAPAVAAKCEGEKKQACGKDCQKSCCKKTESDKKECPKTECPKK